MLMLTIPYPPSVNTYWGFQGSRRYLTTKAKIFKELVWVEFKKSKNKGFSDKRLFITVNLYAPDKRVRDIDNSIKSLLDALCQAGIFKDDSQVDRLHVYRGGNVKGGLCTVIIQEIPLAGL